MSIRDDFFAAKAKGSLWDVAVSIKRGNPLPLDADSIFDSYSALEAYAAGVLAYPGQLVAVVNADSTGIYYLDQNLAIKSVGVIPSGDDKTIEVTAEGAISLLGAAGAANGTLPIIGENGKLTWKTLEAIGAGDGNDNTTYEITPLEKGAEGAKETYGIQIQVKENGVATGDPIVIDFDVYTKSEIDTAHSGFESRIAALETAEDQDTTYSVKAGEKILKLEGTEFSTVASLKYVAATESATAKIQLLGIDGALVSEIDATPFIKDGMLEDVAYDADTNTITFTWNTAAGTKTDTVVLSDIIEPYTAGNGLQLTGNSFSAKIDSASEGFLTAGEGGLKLAGIQSAIDTAKGEAATDAQTKANKALEDAKSDAASLYATKAFVGSIPDGYTETSVVAYVNKKAEETLSAAKGDSTETVATVKQQLDDYKTANDAKVDGNSASITTINNKLTTIEENAEKNTIEIIKKNGVALEVKAEDRSVDIIVPGALTDLTGWTALDERVTAAKTQADKGVSDAAAAAASAATNAEEIGKHETRIGALETTKSDHETRIIALENADTTHAAEYNALKGIVDGHTTTLASKADQTTVDGISSKATANETAIKTINETTIPALQTEIGKKANSADVYTKTEIGTIAEGKTIVQMIDDAKTAATYDDKEVRKLISDETARATGVEGGLDTRLAEVETFFAAVETPDEVIDTLSEIVSYIESDRTGAAAMAGNISTNAQNIEAINNEQTGILAQAKNYTDTQIGLIPVASPEAPGLVKFDDVSIKKNENNQLYVAAVSTDILVQGTQELIIDGGNASK